MSSKSGIKLFIKLAGLFALWKFIQSVSFLIEAVRMFNANPYIPRTPLLIPIFLSMVFKILVIGFIAFMCLLKTNWLFKLLQNKKNNSDNPNVVN